MQKNSKIDQLWCASTEGGFFRRKSRMFLPQNIIYLIFIWGFLGALV